MFELSVAIFAAISGALATHYVPLLHKSLSSGKNKHLNGQWLSLSYANEDEGWIPDRIDISSSPVSISLANKDRPHGYEYECRANWQGTCYLVGKWWSTKPGANNSGPFSFWVSPHGDFMYGFYGGSGRDGSFRWAIWCLGRDEEALLKAKAKISDAAVLVVNE